MEANMHPGDIVFCRATNRVLLAGDAVFDAEGYAYDPERVPDGTATHAFDGAETAERPARPIHTGSVADSTPAPEGALDGPSGAPGGMPTNAEIAAAVVRNDAEIAELGRRAGLTPDGAVIPSRGGRA